ncbi:hypothetical protein Tco_1256976, partial [Tanacetum coccineum]
MIKKLCIWRIGCSGYAGLRIDHYAFLVLSWHWYKLWEQEGLTYQNRFGITIIARTFKLLTFVFADDLFLFARINVSAMVIMESLDEFKSTSGLVLSTLPVKYLGVPLISSRLLNNDCKVLVEQAKNQIGDWKNKSLSFAGRL